MAATSTFQEEVCISDLTTDCRVLTEANPPYRIVHVNTAWCQTTGYDPKQLVGNTCKILQGPETCQRTLQARGQPLSHPSRDRRRFCLLSSCR
jgi:PAS domain-containing protein